MSLSCEHVLHSSQVPSFAGAPYTILEYREDGLRPRSSSDDVAEGLNVVAESSPVSASKHDPAAEFATRLEEERRAIQSRAQLEYERRIQQFRAEVSTAIEQFARERENYFLQAEAEIVNLTLAIARRIIHREVQIDPHLLAGLVHYELQRLGEATSVRLCVSNAAQKYWYDAAAAFPHKVEVVPDSRLDAGEIRIETASGSTTVGFENEIKEIERGFFDLLSLHPVSQERDAARVQ